MSDIDPGVETYQGVLKYLDAALADRDRYREALEDIRGGVPADPTTGHCTVAALRQRAQAALSAEGPP